MTANNADRHREILNSIHESYKRKNHDYGDSFHKSFEKFGLIAPVVRMSDKMGRLETLCQKEAQVKEESIRDTLMDLANYCIMTVMELDAQKEATASV
jgi:hypothetical protein